MEEMAETVFPARVAMAVMVETALQEAVKGVMVALDQEDKVQKVTMVLEYNPRITYEK
jgi:hypothetical protein